MENGDLVSHPRVAPVVMEHAEEAGTLLEMPVCQQPQTARPILEKVIPGGWLRPEPPVETGLQEETASSIHPTQGAPRSLVVGAPLSDPSISLPPISDPIPDLRLTQQTQVSPKASVIQITPAINTPVNETTSTNSLLPDNTNDNTLVDDLTILEHLQPVSQANNTDQRLTPDRGDGGAKLTRQRSATRPLLTLDTSPGAVALKDTDRRPPTRTPKIVLNLDSEPASSAIMPTPFSQHNHSARDGKHTGKATSALTTLLTAEKAHRSPIKKQRPTIQPYYHAFGNMGALYPTRSLSSNAIPTTMTSCGSATPSAVGSIAESPSELADSQVVSSPHDSYHQDPNRHHHRFHRPHFHGLRKSLSMGKTGKTGFSARLRNLRQKHGPVNQEGFTSGESESEYLQDASMKRASGASRKRIPDPSLPPLLMRFNSPAPNSSLATLQPQHTPSIGTPYGYGGMGMAPLSISTKFIGTSSGRHSASATDLPALRDHLRDRDLPRDSSTTRLKGMLKRNVGLSSPAPSTASLNLPAATTMGAGDLLDDLQPYQNSFRVSRLTGRTKRRERSWSRRDRISRGITFGTSDEDEAPLTIPSRQHRYRHLFHRHDRNGSSRREEKYSKDTSRQEQISNDYIPSVSTALQEARASYSDPNTLLAELEPLPPKFVRAFAALKHGSGSPAPSVDASIASGPGMANKIINIPPLPVLMYALPTVAPGSGYVIGGQGGIPGGRGSPVQKSTMMTASTTSGGLFSPSSLSRPSVRGLVLSEKPVEPTPLCTKLFLFKSYQNSKPQGHYLFRIVQDRVEYGKLPVTKESCCSQYFRQADVTYRSLGKKYKLSKDAKHEMLVQHQQEWVERRRLSTEEKFQPLNTTLDKSMTTLSLPAPQRTSVVAFEGYDTDSDHATTSTIAAATTKTTSSRATIHGESRMEKERALSVQESSLQSGPVRVLLSGQGDFKNLFHNPEMDAPFSAHQAPDTTQEASPQPSPVRVLLSGRGDAKALAQNAEIDNSLLVLQGSGNAANTQEDRRDSDLATERSLTPELPPTPPPELSVTPSSEEPLTPPSELSLTSSPPPELSLTPSPETTPSPPPSMPLSTLDPRRPFVPSKKDPVTKLPILNYEQAWQEAQMQAVDNAYWYLFERNRCLEAAEVLYGLDLFLDEIARHVEYERFEAVEQTHIRNENRDTTLFTIANGDRTNMMWLESPSLKLKNEFMNWFSIAAMGRGEPQVTCAALADEPCKTRLDTLVESSTKPPTKSELKQREGDTLIDLTTVRLTLLEKQIAEKRQQISDEMKQIEDALDHLDQLDARAKSMATTMLNAIESQEVQMALQPSLTTGLTLAETVVLKIKEVDDRIVACTKVMGAARLNLNRLRYEIELEQRSIRHFRQYKIMIVVVTLAILAAVWVLFHRRQVMAALLPHHAPCLTIGSGKGGGGEEVSLFSKWNPGSHFFEHMYDSTGSPESDDQALQCPISLTL
ncbi:hypothetical protein BGZ93_004838 [Podila epicladia]|nr:hypothetical protein BGZ92_010353 [Podila epicladia]KAG0096230.1 hypothetical protein BGZ93_004838 [Podila epicladia]